MSGHAKAETGNQKKEKPECNNSMERCYGAALHKSVMRSGTLQPNVVCARATVDNVRPELPDYSIVPSGLQFVKPFLVF
jgi:hypothetical protein